MKTLQLLTQSLCSGETVLKILVLGMVSLLSPQVPPKYEKAFLCSESDRALEQDAQIGCDSPSLTIFKTHPDLMI